jgi:hypothetical protein
MTTNMYATKPYAQAVNTGPPIAGASLWGQISTHQASPLTAISSEILFVYTSTLVNTASVRPRQ